MRAAAAVGCRAHTGWAVLVVVAEGRAQPVLRERVELGDPAGRVRRNVYQAARGLELAEAARLVEAAERIAAERAAEALERTGREAAERGALLLSCAVVVGASTDDVPLASIVASHVLAHAAEGRLYQRALLHGAAARGLEAVAIPKRSIWAEGESALALAEDELRHRLAELRRQVGPPWAEDQKLATLAAWIALAHSA